MNPQHTQIKPSPSGSMNGSRKLMLMCARNQHSVERLEKPASGVLNSWKEIAAYLNRGVRTVQRWESALRLPVHRPKGKNRSAVIALREEIDDWLRHTPSSSGSKYVRNSLFEIACDLQNLAQKLVTQASSEMRPEGEKLLEVINSIMLKLTQLPSGSRDGNSQLPS